MLKRYDIIALDDLRDAADRASQYVPERAGSVVPLRTGTENTDRTPTVAAVGESSER